MLKNHKGFTIVELLIVIVVIGILASITVVSFKGVSARATAVRNQSAAKATVDKMRLWQALAGGILPTYAQLTTNSMSPTGACCSYTAGGAAGPAEAKLGSGVVLQYNAYPTFGSTELAFIDCGTEGNDGTGYYIVYLDPTDAANVKAISVDATIPITYGSGPMCV